MNFGPGEYHITQVSCSNSEYINTVGKQETHLASISFKHSYASFKFKPLALHELGLIRFHITNGSSVRVDRVELPAETREAVRLQHPQEFAKLISASAAVDPDTSPEKLHAFVEPQRQMVLTTYRVRSAENGENALLPSHFT